MAVDLTKYEIKYPVAGGDKALKQAELLARVVIPGHFISVETLDTFIAMQNRDETGHELAIAVPPDVVVEPLAIIESLKRAA